MPRGRPKAFCEDDCVDKATQLFWQRGYESTSMDDLTEALGIGPSSLYRTFGSKEELFERCVDKYEEVEGNLIATQLDSAQRVAASLRNLLFAAAGHYTRSGKPRGCMVVLTSIDRCGAPSGIERMLKQRRRRAEKAIASFIASGKERGDVRTNADEVAAAKFVFTTMQGMSLQARDGAKKAELEEVADLASEALVARLC